MDFPKQPKKPKTKLILIATFTSLLLITTLVIAITVQSHKNTSHSPLNAAAQAVVKSTCAATRYPELCASTIAAAATAITSSKDVLITALNYTIYTVERNYFTVRKISTSRSSSLTRRERTALHDCLEMIDDTLEELRETEAELKDFGFTNYTLSNHKENLITLLSACQTNQVYT